MSRDGNAGRAVELELLMAGYGEEARDAPSGEDIAELVRRAKAGELSAFDQIIRLYERRVFRTALRLLSRVEDAQDAAQEVYLRLYRHIRSFDEKRDLAPWLYQLTVNACRDLNRRRRKSPALSLEDLRLRGAEGASSGTFAGPYEQAAQAQEWRLMAEALDSLPEKERAAVVLRDLEGLPTRKPEQSSHVEAVESQREGRNGSEPSLARSIAPRQRPANDQSRVESPVQAGRAPSRVIEAEAARLAGRTEERAENAPAAVGLPAPAGASREESAADTPAPRFEVVSMPSGDAAGDSGSEEMLLKIATNDPKIVIYWLLDENGDKDEKPDNN